MQPCELNVCSIAGNLPRNLGKFIISKDFEKHMIMDKRS